MKNQKGFSHLLLIAIVVILAVGGAGWYVWQKDDSKSTTSTQNDLTFSGADKSKYILDFDKASASLKTALLNTFFDDAKTNCIKSNESVSADARLGWVMGVSKMVRDEFAGVQFCGSGATSIFAKVNNEWKAVGSLAETPVCSLVDQYRISKEITAMCRLDKVTTRAVTYN